MLVPIQKTSIVLPISLLQQAGFSVGDMLDITSQNGGLFIKPVRTDRKDTQPSEYQQQYIAMLNRVVGSIDDPTFTEPSELENGTLREMIL